MKRLQGIEIEQISDSDEPETAIVAELMRSSFDGVVLALVPDGYKHSS